MPCSSSSSSPSSMWASLPADILDLLVRSLQSSFDRLRFGAVCKSWREVAAAVKQNPTSRCGVTALPIMTFIEHVDGVKGGPLEAPAEVDEVAAATPVTRCFYSLSEDKVYRLQVPSESRSWRCFGSSHGWLGVVDLCLNTFLFDPISGARVDLPALTTLTNVIVGMRWRKKDGAILYVCKDPFEDKPKRGLTATEARDLNIDRLTLSSSPLDSNCIVMALISALPSTYARPGGDSWVQVPNMSPRSRYGRDIIYHDRRFYALAWTGETIAIDFFKECSKSHPENRDHIRPPTVEIIVPGLPPEYFQADAMYVVALPSGEIVQVVRYVLRDHPKPYETEAFDVCRLTEGGEWEEVDYIGDCCLFVGFNESMSLPAFAVLGKHRTNCIFFTDNIAEAYIGKDYGGLDFGIYDFEEEEIDHFCHINLPRLMPPPMWFTPSL